MTYCVDWILTLSVTMFIKIIKNSLKKAQFYIYDQLYPIEILKEDAKVASHCPFISMYKITFWRKVL